MIQNDFQKARLLQAQCEFWFDPRRGRKVSLAEIETTLRRDLQPFLRGRSIPSEPFLRFDHRYLSVALPDEEFRWPEYFEMVNRALATYLSAAKGPAITTLCLHYAFSLGARAGEPSRRESPLTMEMEQFAVVSAEDYLKASLELAGAGGHLSFGYLWTEPFTVRHGNVHVWLKRVHRRLDRSVGDWRRAGLALAGG